MRSNENDPQAVVPSANGRPARAAFRGRRGVLEPLMDIPLDVLFETLSFLDPQDLLNLTRVSKSFRRTLLQSNSKTVWQQCRRNLCHGGIPKCPVGLSEPHYAHLLFEPTCHRCGNKGARWLSLFARIRLCTSCTKRVCAEPELPPEICNTLLPITTTIIELPPNGPYRSYRCGEAFIPHLNELYEEYRGLIGQEAQESWISEKARQQKVIEQELRRCLDYFNNCGEARERELEADQTGRKLEIIRRLKDLGWEDELVNYNGIEALSTLDEVNKRKALTERAWEGLKPTLETFLRKRREKRLRSDRTSLISQRCSVLKEVHTRGYSRTPVGTFSPNVGDLTSVEGVLGLILDTPQDNEVTIDHLERVLGQNNLKYFAWVQNANSDLLDIVRRSSLGPIVDCSVLWNVTTLFHCVECPMPISYPQVLVHDCHSRKVSIDNESADLSDVFQHLQSRPWIHSAATARLAFDEVAHQTAKDILSAMGLQDAEIAHNPIDFNFWNPYVEYVPSNSSFESSEKIVMRWSEALCFSRKLASENHPGRPFWRGLLRDEQARAVEAERQLAVKCKKNFPPNFTVKWSRRMAECVHCSFRKDVSGMKNHSMRVHKKVPVIGWDYRLHIDAIWSWRTMGTIKIAR